MRIQFNKFEALADALVDRIGGGSFKRVKYSQATNSDQLWSMCEAMTVLPVAIVAISAGNLDELGLRRTLQVLVFIVTAAPRGIENEAAGIWRLNEEVLSKFLPETDDRGQLAPVQLLGVEFTPQSWAPVASPPNLSANVITISGIEFATQG